VLLYLILPILIIVPMSFSSSRFLAFPRRPGRCAGIGLSRQCGLDAGDAVTLTIALSTSDRHAARRRAAYAISQSKWRIMRASI